jgi:hypothetical protein
MKLRVILNLEGFLKTNSSLGVLSEVFLDYNNSNFLSYASGLTIFFLMRNNYQTNDIGSIDIMWCHLVFWTL